MRKERLKIESRINKLKKQVFLNYFFNNINKSKIYKSECWLFWIKELNVQHSGKYNKTIKYFKLFYKYNVIPIKVPAVFFGFFFFL